MLLVRCFAALGDIAKARYLRETHELAKQKELETVSIWLHYYHYVTVVARGYQGSTIFRWKYD